MKSLRVWAFLLAVGSSAIGPAAACGQAAAAKDESGPRTDRKEAADDGADGDASWAEMETYFRPPARYRDAMGSYRSVLKFEDGTPVRTPEDWARRRDEILRSWRRVLGTWPDLIEKPRIRWGEKQHEENFTRHQVELEVAPGRFVDRQYVLIPDGQGPFPAVVVTWYGSTDSAGLSEKARGRLDFGRQLARRGFVALCLGDVGQDETARGRRIQPLSYLAYAAANAGGALANLPEVAPDRIGILGHSFGGKWAMFASCLHDRFACAVWIDPGIVWNERDANANYWEKWYLGYDFDRAEDDQRREGIVSESNPRSGAYKTLWEQGRDLHELHALMAPRPFLVSGGAQDRPDHWIALNHAIALNRFLGRADRVAMTMRDGHSPTPESNAQVFAFLKHFLGRPAESDDPIPHN